MFHANLTSSPATSTYAFDPCNIYDDLKRALSTGAENITQCNVTKGWIQTGNSEMPSILQAGRKFYAYFTPVILLIGFVGNSLSLNVFISKNMRSLSASTYLAALSTSDLLTLVFYVTIEWLRRGLGYLYPDVKMHFIDINGICQLQLYLSYVSRFLSAWIVVAFTVERYIGVCHPLRRRDICTTSSTRRIIASTFLMAAILCIYKPILSGIYISQKRFNHYCTTSRDHEFLSFALDSVFAVSITLVPFVIITVLNVMIIRRLFIRNKRQKAIKVITEESVIRLEFTIILLVISFCFIAFNIPYFAVWCRNFLHSQYIIKMTDIDTEFDVEYWQGILYITRTIFNVNYCINFFLYSITGAYFRREVRVLFSYRTVKRGTYSRCSRLNSNSHTPQSWV